MELRWNQNILMWNAQKQQIQSNPMVFTTPASDQYPATITEIDINGYPGVCMMGGSVVHSPPATRIQVFSDQNTAHMDRQVHCERSNCIQWINQSFVLDRPIVITGSGQNIVITFYNDVCPFNVYLIKEIRFHLELSSAHPQQEKTDDIVRPILPAIRRYGS